MKFLVEARSNEKYYMLPLKIRIELIEKEVDWVEKCLWEGTCKYFYSDDDLKGRTSIWDLNSAKELARRLHENPMHLVMNYHIKPIIEYDEVVRLIELIAVYKGLKSRQLNTVGVGPSIQSS